MPHITNYVGLLKGEIFNTAVVAATDMFATDLEPSDNVDVCLFMFYGCWDAGGIITIRRTNGGVTIAETIDTVVANEPEFFDILVHADDTINIRHSVGGTTLRLIVTELI